jgi:hypothetical protein
MQKALRRLHCTRVRAGTILELPLAHPAWSKRTGRNFDAVEPKFESGTGLGSVHFACCTIFSRPPTGFIVWSVWSPTNARRGEQFLRWAGRTQEYFSQGTLRMAGWDSTSTKANRSGIPLRGDEEARTEASTVEPEVPNRWHPRWTLGFIVLSCGLLWGGVYALMRIL